MDAKTRAVYRLIQTLINIYVILIELQLPIQLPITVFEDNEALIYIQLLIQLNFIMQNILIQFYKVSQIQYTADLLPKPTIGSDFQNKRNKLEVL